METDKTLVANVHNGDRKSLNELVGRHHPFIYNLALRIFYLPEDAEDATQEVLIKMLASLQSFEGRSLFRTWLYRLALNSFLKTRTRLGETLAVQKEGWDEVPQPEVEEKEYDEETIEEVRLLCSTAMLQCLDREQRLLYVVSEIFEADHKTGAELFDLTPANYRLKLHRAMVQLRNYVAGRCGLVNPANPCRCPKKTTCPCPKSPHRHEGTIPEQSIPDKKRARGFVRRRYGETAIVGSLRSRTNSMFQRENRQWKNTMA